MLGQPSKPIDALPATPDELRQLFGAIDIYLFDQLLRGRVRPGMRVLDAGCGGGRNLHYLMRAGYDVAGVDEEAARIASVRALAAELAPRLDPRSFVVASVTALPFEDACFDVVLSNAVLHFSAGPEPFHRSLAEMWRVLAPGGMFWARLASSIGIEDRVVPLGSQRFRLPDGSDRFLVSEAELIEQTRRWGGRLLDPIKTTNVQGARCMTTWVVEKPA